VTDIKTLLYRRTSRLVNLPACGRHGALDAQLEIAAPEPVRILRAALGDLVGLAHIDQGRAVLLGREGLGMASIIFVDAWRSLPLATIIVLAGRLSIPRERLEQAQIDGAGFFRTLFRIVIPALAPVLIVAILFTALLVIGEMSTVELLTQGGPGHSTQILPYWAYLKGIQSGDLAQGAAVALFLFPVLLAAAIIALRFAVRLSRD